MGKEAFNERLKACARELSQIPHDKVRRLYLKKCDNKHSEQDKNEDAKLSLRAPFNGCNN